METRELVLLCLLMAADPVTCQQGLRSLQPWMQGLIAAAVFLIFVAIAFAVNHFWCQKDPPIITSLVSGCSTEKLRREPGTTVISVGGKSDGTLAGVDGRYSTMASNFRSSEHKNAYENENVMEDIPGVRSTRM
ncbi:PDZK1-interacting protein 1-like isoform X1 [Petaurus breviceps papuanus]|uniref:PDZK1-interacting protein 1-like isoform X1 n=1 Tax=Petaurus breviceps papuanus TaxID=3040969 RepID=UPI0036D8DD15